MIKDRTAREARTALELQGKRGSKVLEHVFIDTDSVEKVTVLTLQNVRGRALETVAVREPAEARRAHSIFDGSQISCGCGSLEFFDLGRSLHYENLQCTECSAKCSPLTESGACF